MIKWKERTSRRSTIQMLQHWMPGKTVPGFVFLKKKTRKNSSTRTLWSFNRFLGRPTNAQFQLKNRMRSSELTATPRWCGRRSMASSCTLNGSLVEPGVEKKVQTGLLSFASCYCLWNRLGMISSMWLCWETHFARTTVLAEACLQQPPFCPFNQSCFDIPPRPKWIRKARKNSKNRVVGCCGSKTQAGTLPFWGMVTTPPVGRVALVTDTNCRYPGLTSSSSFSDFQATEETERYSLQSACSRSFIVWWSCVVECLRKDDSLLISFAYS